MPRARDVPALSETLRRVQATLLVSQKGLAEILGRSSRTIIRYGQGRGVFLDAGYEKLARACHPKDAVFAAELGGYVGKTLIDLGLEAPPPPPTPAPPPPPPLAVMRPAPTPAQMVDSVVCAAAEAMETTPQAMRPGLKAAFERVVALGMTAEEVLGAMAPRAGSVGASRRGTGKAPAARAR